MAPKICKFCRQTIQKDFKRHLQRHLSSKERDERGLSIHCPHEGCTHSTSNRQKSNMQNHINAKHVTHYCRRCSFQGTRELYAQHMRKFHDVHILAKTLNSFSPSAAPPSHFHISSDSTSSNSPPSSPTVVVSAPTIHIIEGIWWQHGSGRRRSWEVSERGFKEWSSRWKKLDFVPYDDQPLTVAMRDNLRMLNGGSYCNPSDSLGWTLIMNPITQRLSNDDYIYGALALPQDPLYKSAPCDKTDHWGFDKQWLSPEQICDLIAYCRENKYLIRELSPPSPAPPPIATPSYPVDGSIQSSNAFYDQPQQQSYYH